MATSSVAVLERETETKPVAVVEAGLIWFCSHMVGHMRKHVYIDR